MHTLLTEKRIVEDEREPHFMLENQWYGVDTP
jgi:hypothetical protein